MREVEFSQVSTGGSVATSVAGILRESMEGDLGGGSEEIEVVDVLLERS